MQQRAPRAHLTPLGWCVVGPIDGADRPTSCNHLAISDTLDETVRNFLLIDTIGVKVDTPPLISQEERKYLENSSKHHYIYGKTVRMWIAVARRFTVKGKSDGCHRTTNTSGAMVCIQPEFRWGLQERNGQVRQPQILAQADTKKRTKQHQDELTT